MDNLVLTTENSGVKDGFVSKRINIMLQQIYTQDNNLTDRTALASIPDQLCFTTTKAPSSTSGVNAMNANLHYLTITWAHSKIVIKACSRQNPHALLNLLDIMLTSMDEIKCIPYIPGVARLIHIIFISRCASSTLFSQRNMQTHSHQLAPDCSS